MLSSEPVAGMAEAPGEMLLEASELDSLSSTRVTVTTTGQEDIETRRLKSLLDP